MALETIEAEQKRQDLSEALSKIRHHTSSKIPNQKAPAQLLIAVEATLETEDGKGSKERSPTEYLMALLSLLNKAISESQGTNSTLLPSAMYLLTLVTPFVAAGVLRSQLSSLINPLAFVLSSSYPSSSSTSPIGDSFAALLKSAMGVLQHLVLALSIDRATLSSNLELRGCWNSTLRLCMDARPKVRRKAQEVVQEVLELGKDNVKPHPYAAKTAEWAITALEQVNISGSISSQVKAPTFDRGIGRAFQPEVAAAERQKRADSGSAHTGIWICAFLRQLVPIIPSKSIPHLSTNLLRLISQRNPFLSTAAFEVFESLFQQGRPSESSGINPASLSSTMSNTMIPSKKFNTDSISQTLDALCSSSVEPSSNDVQLVPAYLRALENAMVAYSRVDAGLAAWQRLPSIWRSITNLALSTKSKASRDSPLVRAAGGHALSALIRYCIPDVAIDEAVQAKEKGEKHSLLVIVSFFEDSLDAQALRYSHSRPAILSTLAAFLSRLRYGPATDTTGRRIPAASELLLPLVAAVGSLRSQPNFQNREEADTVIGAAIEVCRPAAVLQVLPLNLFGEEGVTGGKAWLLPLMKSRITNTQLAYFVSTMVPLSETLFNKRAEAEEVDTNGKPKAPVQAKVYEALIEQVWALFPGFCDLPTDLIASFQGEFLDLLGNVLYSQSTLRSSICRGLQLLVERNVSLAHSAADSTMLRSNFGLDAKDGSLNVKHLSSLGPNLLAILFNVYSQSAGESRGYLADCMTAFIGIISKEELSKLYFKISTMLQESLPTLVPAKDREMGPGSIPPVPHTMLDLLSLLIPSLEVLNEGQSLFKLACDDSLLTCRDAGLQKKTYRLLSRLIKGKRGQEILETNRGNMDVLQELLRKLDATSGNVVPGAKKDRTALLAVLIPLIPQSELHFLPTIIPEAILATKEVNQGARELAYTLLVEMGNKMDKGGQIKRHLVESNSKKAEEKNGSDDEEINIMSDDPIEEDIVDANLNEYITMIAAGLAGSSPHMISATITALARLVYEFHSRLPLSTLKELVSTLEVFMASPNREVVKSTLGFVKVAIVSLPGNTIEDSLPTLVTSLLSNENHHRQHFKAKIRHIFERLLRRFGYEVIESMTDEESRKLLVNIRKRKERAKRKKATQSNGWEGLEEEDDDDENVGNGIAGQRAAKAYGADAFEEAIYGSESDLSASEEEGDADDEKVTFSKQTMRKGRMQQQQQQKGKGERKKRRDDNGEGQEYILQDDDAPMDLLDRSVAAGGRVIAGGVAKGNRKRQPGQEARQFELDEATGRMVIDEDGNDDGKASLDKIDVEGAGRAYLDRERGVHGVISKDGAIRVNKNNKRNRAVDEELELEQMMLEEQQQHQQIQSEALESASIGTKKKKIKKVKENIGSEFKAKKAGGDVKKGQMKPFAYVPLNQIGSKNKKTNVKILAKDKRRD